MLSPCGKRKGREKMEQEDKVAVHCLVLIRAGVAAHQFTLIHGVTARSDQLFLLFIYLFIY